MSTPRPLAAIVADLDTLRDVSDAQTVPLNHEQAIRLLIEAAEATAAVIAPPQNPA